MCQFVIGTRCSHVSHLEMSSCCHKGANLLTLLLTANSYLIQLLLCLKLDHCVAYSFLQRCMRNKVIPLKLRHISFGLLLNNNLIF